MPSGLVDHVRELAAGIPGFLVKRMFGGWGLFSEGRMFGLIAQDVVYLKSDADTDPAFEEEGLGHFEYDTRAGAHHRMNYRRLPERCLDDGEEFEHWARLGMAAARRSAEKPPAKSRKKLR